MLFYPEDTVRVRPEARVAVGAHDADEYALVVRVWHNEAERIPLDEDVPHDPTGLARALVEGEYGIELFPSRQKSIVMGDVLEVVDRAFQVGDVCKRVERTSPESTAPHPLQHLSGVVTDVSVSIDLRHIISMQRIPQRVPVDEIRPAENISVGDHVVYGDWLGVVEYKFQEAQIASDFHPNQLRKAGSAHAHSLTYGHIRSDPRDELNPMIDRVRPVHLRPEYKPKLVNMQTTFVAIDWLAINGKLTPEQQEAKPRPAPFWRRLHQLTLVRQFINHKYELDDAVEFVSPALAQRYGLVPTKHADNVNCSVMRVVGVHSTVKVLWQNGTETQEGSTNLLPYLEVDDHDVWPGDHVLFRDADGVDRGAVVRTMDPAERTATIALYRKDTPLVDPATERVVSVLDIKTAGSQDYPVGVHRGDVVLVSAKAGSYIPPTVGRLGQVHEGYDGMSEEELLSKLEEMGGRLMRSMPDKVMSPPSIPIARTQATQVDWYGAVVDLKPDGAVVVELPCGLREDLTMDKVTLLDDGFDDTGEEDWSEDEDDMSSVEEDVPWETEEGVEAEDEGWEDFDDANGADDVMKESEKETAAMATNGIPTTTNGTSTGASDSKLATFAVIEEAPVDHAFLGTPPTAAPQRQFLSRLQREYSILKSSLPDTIMVRGYEDRTDLLRALIIGTPGTPYEDAPFCIDFQLKPNYPFEPPVAHFHSWSDGQGRLSPNLYEEGRICLSILNTWSGEQSESWNPAKSTLLQVLVSIQGLVLVAEPYFTEPGYERQADTEQGRLNSRHYSERAYVIARRFILHVVRKPIAGMEHEVQVLYRDRGRLRQVVDKAAVLCGKPGAAALPSGAWSEGSAMTKGGLLSLERILADLSREAERDST